jgi:hypothetical protein
MSHGRDAVAGSSLRADSARAEAKPPRPSGDTVDSAPPATITSASPHAVLDRQVTGNHIDDRGRHEERRDTARTALIVIFLLRFDHRQAADAGTNDHANAIGIFLGHGDSGILDCLDAGCHAEVDEFIHVTRFFGVEVVLDVEAFHFTRETGGEGRRVKTSNVSDPGFALGDGFPRVGNAVADGGNHTKAGDHYTTVFRTQASLPEWIGESAG